MSFGLFIFKDLFIIYFWLCRVLVAARGMFVEACGWDLSLRRAGFSLVTACGFSLSSCGVQVPEHVGSVV